MSVRPIVRAALLAAFAAPALAVVLRAADAKPPAAKPKPAATKPATTKPAEVAKDDWTAPMDYGPFLMTSVARPGGKPYRTTIYAGADAPKFPVDKVPDLIAAKGIVIPLGPRDAKGVPAATVCFNVDTLAMAGGWTGGWLDLSGTMLTQHKGVGQVTITGTEQFRVKGTGHLAPDNGNAPQDPRPDKQGPVPPTWGQFRGVYVHGPDVVLAYRFGETEFLERPCYDETLNVLYREITVAGGRGTVRIVVDEAGEDGVELAATATRDEAFVEQGDRFRGWMSLGARPMFSTFKVVGRRLVFEYTAGKEPETFAFALATGRSRDRAEVEKRTAMIRVSHEPPSVANGGPARWKPITVAGKFGSVPAKKDADPAFAVDEVTLPSTNPYNSWFRLTGLDFFPDGRAAVCTINGDVWIASGLDDKLGSITWTRHATGLYHPMGLTIVDGNVCVRCRDQLVRLRDLNNDGEADFYENVSSEGFTHPSYHGFVFDLQADSKGRFYYARGGIGMDPAHSGHGRLTRLSANGNIADTLAAGLRAPNGIGLLRDRWVSVGDNQGNWIPSSRISLVDARPPPDEHIPFLGFLPAHHATTTPTTAGERPLVWIPHALDNSSGGQCEIPATAWGPYGGQWIHTSFGAACVMLLLPDAATPAGDMPKQAAVVRLPLDFATGVMRPRFNPKDGQLYVAGVGGGWQTKGTADGGLYRVRHTGQPGFAPTSFAVVPGGVRLTFAQPLDRTEAADVQNYGVEQWNYKWTEKYGSPDFSAKSPDRAGHDEVEVRSAKVSDDGRTVTLTLGDQRPVDQLRVDVRLQTAAGQEFRQAVYATVNVVPK